MSRGICKNLFDLRKPADRKDTKELDDNIREEFKEQYESMERDLLELCKK